MDQGHQHEKRRWVQLWMLFAIVLNTLVARGADLVINEFMANNSTTISNKSGQYADWIEIYNGAASGTNLGGLYLTDDAGNLTKWMFPSTNIEAHGYVLVWADGEPFSVTNGEMHANFKLSNDGEYLALVMSDGVSVAYSYSPQFPEQSSDISYGVGASGEPRYFGIPTPGFSNNLSSASNIVADLKFDVDRGIFTNSGFQVTVTTQTAGVEIRYTTACDVPTTTNTLYTGPVTITNSVVIRADGFKAGCVPAGVDTHTYIVIGGVLHQSSAPSGFPPSWGPTTADYSMDSRIVSDPTYGPMMTNALKSLPSISVVTAKSNLFDTATGIYANPTNDGAAWERPCSLEWIETNNATGFQIDCGLRIQGGYFRNMDVTLKKSFSVRFKPDYGPGKLDFDVFKDASAVDTFDMLVLRAGANDAWNKFGPNNSTPSLVQYIRDEFARRSQIAMGRIAPHGTFVHLYLDGLYWGLYNVTEKPSDSFASAYFGGDKTNWDVLVYQSGLYALDGDAAAWSNLVNLCKSGIASNEVYQKIQGNNPDRTRNPAYPVYLDMEDYIDYLIVEMWVGNSDSGANNAYMLRYRDNVTSTGFKFCVWDAEGSLGLQASPVSCDYTSEYRGGNEPYYYLLSNAEFRLLFADRLQKHMFYGGVLTTNQTIPRYTVLGDLIDPAIVGESARWGDQDGQSPNTVTEWRSERDSILTGFLPQRSAYVLEDFRAHGLYPNIDPPSFNQEGGCFTNGFLLTMTASNGASIFYTLDGTDPRQYGTGAAVGIPYTNGSPVPLFQNVRVKARAMLNTNTWSAVHEAVFTTADMSSLRVTEVMYHPRTAVGAETNGMYEAGGFEFIEFQNTGSAIIGLAGVKFVNGVKFDFACQTNVTTLDAGEYVLVVANLAAFEARYPNWSGMKIAGEFQFPANSLANSGEKLEIVDGLERKISSFTYDNSWYPSTDGAGHSLVPMVTSYQTNGILDYAADWRPSAYINGSPDAADPVPLATNIVLNEIMAHTDVTNNPGYESDDWIELYNAAASPITFGNYWYLSDSADNLKKWMIPATNVIGAHGWRIWDEITGFHTLQTNGFGMSKYEGDVFLSYLPGTVGVDRVVDCLRYKGQERDKAYGRYPDGQAYWYSMELTPGASNRLVTTQEVVISEVMYHPRPTTANPENNINDEYIELHNTANYAASLYTADEGGSWRLAGGAEYTFPSNATIPARGYIVVVPFDPVSNAVALSNFLSAYGLTNKPAVMYGPFAGQMDNCSDRVALERPVAADLPGEPIGWFVVDEVKYFDQSSWPLLADGTGRPLQRNADIKSGLDPTSWFASPTGTPGYALMTLTMPVEAVENDGVLVNAGRVSISAASASDVVVTLISSDPTEVTVTGAVRIVAGQTNALFDLTIWDDGELDGSQMATITASAASYNIASAVLSVNDDESTLLSVILPGNAGENAGILTGRVTLVVAPSTNIVVGLISSDISEIVLPSNVTVLVGQTSAVFNATVINDMLIDGTQSATVTAHVANWQDGVAVVMVLDDENTNLTLALPSSATEGNAPVTGRVSISGTLATNLIVSLVSSDTSEVIVTNLVVIPVGETTVTFSVAIMDDTEADGSLTTTITAIAGGLANSSAGITVFDNDAHHLNFNPITSPQTSGIPFSITITAVDSNGTTVAGFNSSVQLNAVGDGGIVPIQPVNTPIFSGGIWSGNIKMLGVGLNIRISATNDASGCTGQSNPFDARGALISIIPNALINIPVLVSNSYLQTLMITNSGNENLIFSIATNSSISTNGLILYYTFNTNGWSIVEDQSGNDHQGTVNGATWIADGKTNGGAYSFDGINDRISVPDRNDLDLTSNFTVCVWVNPSTLNVNNRAILTKSYVSLKSGYGFEMGNSDGAAWFQSGDSNTWGNGNAAAPAGTLATNQWLHLAATFDGSVLRLYKNGVQVGTDATVNRIAASIRDLWIGAHIDNGGSPYFKGSIDEVVMYSRALSSNEVWTFYQNPGQGGLPGWLALQPSSAVLSPGGSTNVIITFDATGYAAGDHKETSITITCNDFVTPSTNVPISMDIVLDSDHDIVVTAGAYGNVSPTGTIVVTHGQGTNFLVSAASFYHIVGILTNGVSVGGPFDMASTNYVWNSIVADGTFGATFDENLATNNTPQWWLASYGLTNGGWNANALGDQDNDGMATWKEYIAGTSPTNPAEYLWIAQLYPAGTNTVAIVWDTVTGRYYSVMAATNILSTWSNVQEEAYTNIPGTGLPTAYTNSSQTNRTRYLRVKARKP